MEEPKVIQIIQPEENMHTQVEGFKKSFLNKKRTTYAKIVLILLTLGTAQGIYKSAYLLITISKSAGFITDSESFYYAFNNYLTIIPDTIIAGVYLLKLYNLRRDIFLWTNIFFGWSIIKELTSIVLLSYLGASGKGDPEGIWLLILLATLIGPPITMLIWFTFYRHLKKARENNLMDFS